MAVISRRREGYDVVGGGEATTSNKSWRAVVAGIALGVLALAAVSIPHSNRAHRNGRSRDLPTTLKDSTESKDFDADGRYVVTDYDSRKPFASFLPGVGGEWGMPMWAFYVNRGQGIAAFGVENKDNPLLEFEPANKAYADTSLKGFRTMLKVERPGDAEILAQPFFEPSQKHTKRTMLVGMNELEIVEVDKTTGIETRVLYFTIPGEDFPALARRVTFTNVGQTQAKLEIVDGLAKLEPYGVNAGMLNAMGRTLEGWMRVYHCGRAEDSEVVNKAACKLPYFKLSASTADSAQVQMITEGGYVLGFEANGDYSDFEKRMLPIVVDPDVIFGSDTTLRVPKGFVGSSVDALAAADEVKVSKTPCAFALAKKSLAAGEGVTIVSVYGHAKSVEQITEDIAPKIMSELYITKKYNEAVALTERLTAVVQSQTANPLFDAFSRQMMLDNLLRGGYPEFLGDASDPKVYHTFSRIHGDLERDYNNFQIDATFYSQGSGNYRDVNQNRRVDVLLFPKVKDFNLRQFLTLKQADGYNPLTVQTAYFSMETPGEFDWQAQAIAGAESSSSQPELAGLLSRPFRPGQLFNDAAAAGIELKHKKAFLDAAAAAARQVFAANYTHEGFWADHWTYDLDQIISFEAVYPDDVERAMWDAEKLPFYQSSGVVQPRDFKYVEVDGEGTIRQYNSVYDDETKVGLLDARVTKPDGAFQLAKKPDAKPESAEVYAVTPVSKLLLLFATKFALLDPSGMGIEMDSDKPGWNDAMNGLPGLLGSGMAETAETWRVADWLATTIKRVDRPVVVPAELDKLINVETSALGDESLDDMAYWETTRKALEKYRSEVKLFFSGEEVELAPVPLVEFLDAAAAKLLAGIEKSKTFTEGTIMPSYFQHVVTDFEYTGFLNFVGQPFVKATAFETKVFPLFLEGPVRQLKTVSDPEARKAIHDAVLASNLYDAPIGQYKICESLEGQPFEMGRMMAFTPGWLENESIWLHMSFKYYLELLRAGLFEEFWTAMKTGAPYNMDLETYGRPTLECGSFIVSSAYPDEELWGTSFLARLSGSTAEFLSIWLLVMAGPTPFTLDDDGQLVFGLAPALPTALFKDGKASFRFLGGVDVTYHNPSGADAWTLSVAKMTLGTGPLAVAVDGPVATGWLAEAVRALQFDSIDVYLA